MRSIGTRVRRTLSSAVRSVLVPGVVAASLLGVTSGGHPSVHLTPPATTIASELAARHDLPRGTRLAIGDPAKPTVIAYDKKGRLVVTPPRGQTLGSILARGFADLGRIAGQLGADAAHADTTAGSDRTKDSGATGN